MITTTQLIELRNYFLDYGFKDDKLSSHEIRFNQKFVGELEDLIEKSLNDDKERKKEKHLKGYGYDSLVFRYKDARYKQAAFEAMERAKSGLEDKITAKEKADKRAERDFMRFCQITDDLIGEHD